MSNSGKDIFSALGFQEEEAANLAERSKLMIEIVKIINKNGWTQKTAADVMDVTQPRISDLVRGKIDLFTVDALINMLARAGEKPVVLTQSQWQKGRHSLYLAFNALGEAKQIVMVIQPTYATSQGSHNDYSRGTQLRTRSTANILQSVVA